MTAATATTGTHAPDDEQYPALLRHVQASFTAAVAKGPLFATDVRGDLFPSFLAALPPERRQHYSCHACRHFVERYGHLVVIEESGQALPAMWQWQEGPPFFQAALLNLADLVGRAQVTGAFLSSEQVWGTPFTPPWQHLSLEPPADLLYRGALKTAHQAACQINEDRQILLRSLAEFPADIVQRALTLLTSEQLYRSEKCEGVARWLLDLHVRLGAMRNTVIRDQIVWRAAATAPAGFCHVRSSMIGTLLEDLASGMEFSAVKRRFDEKMHPLQYQRPQAPPSAGHLARAEKLVADLRSAAALERRFARLSDIEGHALWRPRPAEPAASGGGVFSHLRPPARGTQVTDLPQVTITWEKFHRTVLPEADTIAFLVPREPTRYAALVTAVNADAPPILQWDTLEARNPVSWYVYSRGSSPLQWGLSPGTEAGVTAVVLQPSQWQGHFEHHGESVFFLLAGCRDQGSPGLCLFPEILKSEYREIRATIEAHSRSGKIQGGDQAEACGIRLQKGQVFDQRFRVTAKGTRTVYLLDRWD